MHYVYVLSNPAIKDDFLKIGFTSDSPKNRAEHLSRSTAIPLDFEVKHCVAVKDKFSVEIRTHLLLNRYRVNKRKEFFKIQLEHAIKAVDLAASYTEYHDIESCDIFSLDNKLSGRIEKPKLNVSGIRIWFLMMANTPSNTKLELILSEHTVDECFMGVKQYSDYYAIKTETARQQLKSFCLNYRDFHVLLDGGKNNVRVFEQLEYLRGHCMWSFTYEFRKLFHNNKVTHLFG